MLPSIHHAFSEQNRSCPSRSDALCVTGTESINVAYHLPVARKRQNVEVLDTRRRWWRATRSAGGHAGEGSATDGRPVKIVVIQEAGLDGFWVHRLLEANGIESHVVDAASIAVPRRRRPCRAQGSEGPIPGRSPRSAQRHRSGDRLSPLPRV